MCIYNWYVNISQCDFRAPERYVNRVFSCMILLLYVFFWPSRDKSFWVSYHLWSCMTWAHGSLSQTQRPAVAAFWEREKTFFEQREKRWRRIWFLIWCLEPWCLFDKKTGECSADCVMFCWSIKQTESGLKKSDGGTPLEISKLEPKHSQLCSLKHHSIIEPTCRPWLSSLGLYVSGIPNNWPVLVKRLRHNQS